MNWDNVKFTARDVAMIVVYVITGTSFVLVVRGDVHVIGEGMHRIESNQEKHLDDEKAFRAKSEAEWTEMKVRVSILEQKVTDLQIQRDAERN
jgi:hypothetical protein